ncbi:MAG: helix-turn-helix domain-containing protein [Candidatus Methanosuratincola sp.]|jgi:AraC-like DNA-binding protein
MSKRKSLDWIREVEIEDLLKNDTKLIAKKVGIDVLIRLWEQLSSFNLYISTVPIARARLRYIAKFYDGTNAKEIASRLGISERTLYRLLSMKPRRGRPPKRSRRKKGRRCNAG